jgi:hypothetical protein
MPSPSYEFIAKVIATYPTINSEWLISGKQPMFKGDKPVVTTDIFGQELSSPPSERLNPLQHAIILPDASGAAEKSLKKGVEEAKNTTKQLDKQVFIAEFSMSENIDHITIFFKNKTFITLRPEE